VTGLVSIVMPCFNAGPMLARALASIAAQTYRDLEIVFVDNNSTDGSFDRARGIAATDPRFVFTSCATQGAVHARNHGYALAQGRYIQWMDADDEIGPQKIEMQVAVLAKGGDVAYGPWALRAFPGERLNANFPAAARPFDDQILRTLSGIWYPLVATLLRREAADRLQAEAAWWPGRGGSDDFEYWSIAALLGLEFRHVAGAGATYNRWSETQYSRTFSAVARGREARDILRRLQGIAARPEIAPRVKPRHQALLVQNCDLWTLPAGSVAIEKAGGRWFELVLRPSGKRIEVRPRDAAIVRALTQFRAVDLQRYFVKTLCQGVAELADQHPLVAETVDRLCRDGVLQFVSSLDDAAAAAEPRRA
jgi:hypothetical protein